MWKAYTRLILARPRLLLGMIALLVVVAGIFASSPRFDISLEAFVTESDRRTYKYDEFIAAFGEDNDILILLQTDTPFTSQFIEKLAALEATAQQSQLVAATFSLRDVFETPSQGLLANPAGIRPILSEGPPTRDEIGRLEQVVRANPFFRRSLLNQDGTMTTFYITLNSAETSVDSRESVAQFLQTIESRAVDLFGAGNVNLAGWPFIKTEMQRAVRSDLMIISPAIAIVSFVFMWFSFGNLRLIIISGVCVLAVIITTLGIFFFLGNALHMATAMLPTLIIAISFAQTIFIISHYTREEGDLEQRISRLVPGAGKPVMLGAVTTAGGFASLLAIPIGPIKDFGVFAAMGIVISFIISMTAIPALILLFRPAVEKRNDRSLREERLINILQQTNQRPVPILLVALVLIVVAIVGVSNLSFETNLKNFFADDHPVNQGTQSLQKMFAAQNAIDFIIERTDGAPLGGDDYRKLDQFLQWLPGREQVVYSQGILAAGEFLMGSKERFISLSEQQPALLPLIFASNSLLSRYLSDDGRLARITIFASDDSADKGISLGKFIDTQSSGRLDGLRVLPSGQSILFAGMSEKLFEGQINSVVVILLFVTLLITLALRSPGIGLMSLVPNSIPILITLGIMGLTGIPLNVITVMVSSVAIGIAVDDTIHFLYHYRSSRASGDSIESSVSETIAAKSRPIFYTSFVLTGAFLTHMLSSFKPTQYLGMLSAITMIGALIGDLLLLPALLKIFRRGQTHKNNI